MNSLKVFANNIYKKENILVTLIFFLSLLSRSIMAFFFGDRSLENETPSNQLGKMNFHNKNIVTH